MTGGVAKGCDRHWQVGPYRFELYRTAPRGSVWRWACVAHGRGSHGSNPIKAFFRLRRWLKEPARPTGETT